MTPEQLKVFCATEEMSKYALERVHIIAGRLYATDSRILVCAPAPEGMADSDATGRPKFEEVLDGCRPSICTTPLPPVPPDAPRAGSQGAVPVVR